MRHPIVIGLQYGDEGKGKITDDLARQTDWVIRFNGGNNAGHTLWLDGRKLVTHSIPSGVLSQHAKNFIGAGCVIDPVAIVKELEELSTAGADLGPARLKIDFRAHVTLPIHLALDTAREAGVHGIGSTKRGIGPTYMTKMDRVGLRVEDVVKGSAGDKIAMLCKTYNPILKSLGVKESPESENLKVVEEAAALLSRYVSPDTAPFYDLVKTQKCVLEGAQGVLLDLDHGNYPFVTSSNVLPAYAAVGTPFPLSALGPVIGVSKAYLTRVGSGPFATELKNETGEGLRARGKEYGATTGRPRRVGWLNVDELTDAIRLSDCTHIVLTKADILSGEKQVFLQHKGKLKAFEGWSQVLDTDSRGKKSMNENFEAYVKFVEDQVGIPIVAVGTGPDRADVFWRKPGLDFWKL